MGIDKLHIIGNSKITFEENRQAFRSITSANGDLQLLQALNSFCCSGSTGVIDSTSTSGLIGGLFDEVTGCVVTA